MLSNDRPGPSGDPQALGRGRWNVDPRTGIISVTAEAFEYLCNKDPFEKWYRIDSEPINRGQFSTVYHCVHCLSGEEFAAKVSPKRRLGSDCTADLIHEVAVCSLLRDAKNVVALVDVFNSKTDLILVMEYAPGGDLQMLLDQDLVPYERNVIIFLRQILESLVVIHEKNIVHLDIKPQNLVLMGDFPDSCLKLCDFEISRMLSPRHDIREILGTADYIAPEIIHYEPITTKTDMWSFGVLTYVLLTGFLPFGGENDQETFLEITKGELDFPEELFGDISEHAIDFIKKLIIKQPDLRMSARECINHAWIQAEKKMSKWPPRLSYLESNNATTYFDATSDVYLNPSMQINDKQNDIIPHFQNKYSLSLPPTPNSTSNVNEIDYDITLQKTLDILESDAYLSASRTSSKHMTPDALSPLSNSPRNNSINPISSQNFTLMCPSKNSSTNSLNRGQARQSLERLRSVSKSREVLAERLSNSAQKKVLSRSRDRIFDGRYGLKNSSKPFLGNRSFSQSFETLPPLNCCSNNKSLNNSSSSVNLLPILSMLPMLEMNLEPTLKIKNRNNSSRQNSESNNINLSQVFQSLSLPSHKNCDKLNACEASKQKRNNLNSSNFSQRNLNNTKNVLKPVDFIKNKNIKCDIKPDSNSSKLHHNFTTEDKRKPENKKIKDEIILSEKEKERNIRNTTSKSKIDAYGNKKSRTDTKPNINRRGSVSHTEQRIIERRERKKEKQNKATIKKQKQFLQPDSNTVIPKSELSRNNSKTDRNASKSRLCNKNNLEHSPIDTSNTELCKKLMPSYKQEKLSISTITPARVNKNTRATCNNNKTYSNCVSETKLCIHSKIFDSLYNVASEESKNTSTHLIPTESEAYMQSISGEHIKIKEKSKPFANTNDDRSFNRSDSMESSTSIESSSTLKAEEMDFLEATMFNLSFENPNFNITKPQSNHGNVALMDNTSDFWSDKRGDFQDLKTSAMEIDQTSIFNNLVQDISVMNNQSLTIIKEECETLKSFRLSGDSHYTICKNRKLSITDEKVLSSDDDSSSKLRYSPPNHSVRSGPFASHSPLFPFKLYRSNSIHLDSPLIGKARPWGEVCDGAVNRAREMFSKNSLEITLIRRKSSDPTSDRY